VSANANYKLIKKIKDDRFDEEKLHQYRLLIQIGVRDFQVAVVAESDNRLLFFEDYILSDLSSYSELLSLIKSLFESHATLQAGFWKEVKVSVKNSKFVQVPTSLFESKSPEAYLKFNAAIDSAAEKILSCENHSAGITTVFAVQNELVEWLSSLYQNTSLTFYHQSTALIEGVLAYSKKNSGSPLYIYVDRFKLHILATENEKLLYYNQFVINQFSDYAKYIMLALKGLGMDQQTSQIILWGYIGKNSPHYQEFIKYIRNVDFGSRPAHLSFGYLFDEVQEHHFFDLYSVDLLGGVR
jgi:hypothetical protein